MLVGITFEQANDITARDVCARHLADEVRNIWLRNRGAKVSQWEEGFYERMDVMDSLRKAGFPHLDSLDYVFKWWGSKDPDGLAGELTVIWKIADAATGAIKYYRTYVRLAERDFSLGMNSTETEKREQFRKEFVDAFSSWQAHYPG